MLDSMDKIFVKDLNTIAARFIALLQPMVCRKEVDPYWEVIFPFSKARWCFLYVSTYRGTFYITDNISGESLQYNPEPDVTADNQSGLVEFSDAYTNKRTWALILHRAAQWLEQVEADWVLANKIIRQRFPHKYRTGIVPSAVVAHYFPEYRHLNESLGPQNTQKMLDKVEQTTRFGSEAGLVGGLTAKKYFDYCQLAYMAVGRATQQEDGRTLYERLADGRDEGLLDIDPESETEFADWIDDKHPLRDRGGHPWEILRGGNTSNVQLQVRRPRYGDKDKFLVEVLATGITRLAESIKIFLAICDAGLPIAIHEPETIRDQLLLLDNVGILPEYSSLHRGVQAFETSQKVNQVAHLEEFKAYLPQLLPFISWEPLPVFYGKFKGF